MAPARNGFGHFRGFPREEATTLSDMTRTAQRMLTPDVARGFMLLLIALANIPRWSPDGDLAGTDLVSQVWVLTRTLLVDGRAYPLFSILFGFGLASIAARYDDPRRGAAVLRRRGRWLIVFGFAHACLFPGDILGLYGLTAVLLAGMVARRRHTALIVLACFIAAFSVLAMLAVVPPDGSGSPAELAQLPWPLLAVTLWLAATVGGVVMTATVPCVVIGVLLQRTSYLSSPGAHRGTLLAVGAGGLAAAALAAVPRALSLLGDGPGSGAVAVQIAGGYAGGLGWLALIAWGCSYVPGPSAVRLLTAIGQRSMTCYLSQSICFAVLFLPSPAPGGLDSLTPAGAALVAAATWLAIGVAAAVLDHCGLPGPFEALSRRLIYGRRKEVRDATGAAT